ncbi:MAG TPA: serine/threonine-protein kinase [Candidatus Polarisedimenticolaceae bacterium]|nr:serine/threonine-protein kinase [Candidatus Polarisedimenticolaceae bacterium]
MSGHDPDATHVSDSRPRAPLPPPSLPRSIGPYRIVRVLGQGGMGVVYEAEQASLGRTVALKVVRAGQFVDEDTLRMFAREADTLARLKHPNIAAIYEAGRTEDGQHFFAMELVRGPMLGDCMGGRPVEDRARLVSRLALFRTICDAVQYAHQRGVIHRDLKPSNIIVTEEWGRPTVKILDFGLARITDSDVAVATRVTEVGMIKGTLAYMSPEQARGNPDEIDVRSDVYALGVILYEMLVAGRPHALERSTIVDALRVISTEPPLPLRTRWRGGFRLDEDLDTIVGKALQTDADQRYATAAALSDDLGRYLTSQPIQARPPSTIYQLRKAIARNRAPAALAAALALSIVGFGIWMGVLYARAARAQAEAERQAKIARAVNDFLNDDLLAGADPTRTADRDISMRKVVDLASARIRNKFGEEPVVKASIQRTLGQTYLGLGLGEQAGPALREALSLLEKSLGPDDPETLRTASALGSLELYLARYDEAANTLTRTGDAQARLLGEGARDTLATRGALAQVRYEQGRLEDAGALAAGVLERARQGIGEDADPALAAANLAATVALDQGRLEEAEKSFLHLLEILRKRAGTDDDIQVLSTLSNLGQTYFQQERYWDAERVTAETLARARRVLGNEHRETLNYVNNLAMAKRRLDKMDEAGALYREGYETSKRMFGASAGPTLISMVNLASFYGRAGMCPEQVGFVEETVAVCRAHSMPDTPNLGLALRNLAQCRDAMGRPAEAEHAYLEAEKQLTSVLRADDPMLLAVRGTMADFYARQGRTAEAASWKARAEN